MIIPDNISKEHLLKAISKIDLEGIPKDGDSQYYDVVFEGKRYPPKLIVSYANLFANGVLLDRKLFPGGVGTLCFKILEDNDFVIENKPPKMRNSVNFWIEKTHVNGRVDRVEGNRALGKALWSPRKDKRGGDIYKNMRNIKAGDIILHLVDERAITGISLAKKSFVETYGTKGTEWDVPSYLVELEDFIMLDPAIDRKDILSDINKSDLIDIAKKSEVFYTREMKLRQGAYLTPCPYELFEIINKIYKSSTGTNLPNFDMREVASHLDIDEVKQNSIREDKYLNYYLSIKTKPFIILAGFSGTGKSRLVRTLAYKFNNIKQDIENKTNPPSNFQLIKVKPNWHDSSDLLGYESRISGKDILIITDFIRFIVKAWENPETPFFLCLDEMNLAPVEQYFAEYLSVIETRRLVSNNKIVTDPILNISLLRKYANKEGNVDKNYDLWKELNLNSENEILKDQFQKNGICLPQNLIVMGTVNMDETTHSFSRKVLDRAMTIEMNEIDLSTGLKDAEDDWRYSKWPLNKEVLNSSQTQGFEVYNIILDQGKQIIDYLNEINIVFEGTPFKVAYRVRDEFLLYAYNYSLIDDNPANWMTRVLDDMTIMKILPRIEGDEERTILLDQLEMLFKNKKLAKSLQKVNEMINRRKINHYTSFWS